MITYDLAAGRRLSAPPQVRYTDRVEEWAIVCTGRDLRPAVSWRAAVATARKIDAATIIAETDTGITATENTVLVPLDVFFAAFRDAVAIAEKGRDLWFALWGTGADGKTVEYIEFQFSGFPAIDPPGEAPKPLPIRPTTTVNGLSGPVRLVDADGNPFAVEGQDIVIDTGGGGYSGLFPVRNPAAQIPERTDALGVYHRLDATVTGIDLAYPVWKLVEIRALVRSVNPAITGTVFIDLYVDDVKVGSATINVGATWAAVTIPLAVETGSIRLVRTGGTLADGSWVAAAFRGITAMVTI